MTNPKVELCAMSNGKWIRLCSLMMVSGHHWFEDVAGENDGSWKNVLTRAGYEVTCVRTGLLERKEIREILIRGI